MANSPSPRVSVIAPVCNDPTGICDTLTALTKQTCPTERVSILPIDSESTDETHDAIRQFEREHKNVTLVAEDEIQGSYAARSTGIEQATGEVFAFINADMYMDGSWFETVVDAMDEAAYVGCNIELITNGEDAPPARFDTQTAFLIAQYIRQQQYTPTCRLLVSREVVDDVGPFDECLVSGGDSEFGGRVANAGYRQVFTPAVALYHPARDSFSPLVRKELHVGRGLCQRQEYYADRFDRPGISPRPSGVKSPDEESSGLDFERLLFGTLSVVMTGAHTLGYYHEYVRYVRGDTC